MINPCYKTSTKKFCKTLKKVPCILKLTMYMQTKLELEFAENQRWFDEFDKNENYDSLRNTLKRAGII